MTNWFCINLGDPLLAEDTLAQIKDRFRQAYSQLAQTPEPAIFIRHESAGLHCEVKLYFSPAASVVAKAFGAIPCDKPAAEDMGLFAGRDNAWLELFPIDT